MLEPLLNRLRGTGDVFWNITGLQLYALYIFVGIAMLSTWYYGFVAAGLFIAGESFSCGKWVGYLVDYEDKHTPEYDSKVGKSFPYIHYIADAIVKEKEDYKKYCQVALAIRGFFWFAPLLVFLGYIGIMNWLVIPVSLIMLSVGFPFACEIGRDWDYNKKFGVLEFKRGWENQEIVYGFVHFVAITLPLLFMNL